MDTIVDANEAAAATGFLFSEVAAEGMLGAFDHALELWPQPLVWRRWSARRCGSGVQLAPAERFAALHRRLALGAALGVAGRPTPFAARSLAQRG